MAVLDVIEREGLRENVARGGRRPEGGAGSSAKARCAAIGDVRGHGLFIGVEIVKDGSARGRPIPTGRSTVVNRLKDKGFLDEQCRRLQERRQDPAAAGLRAASHADEFLIAFDATMAEIDG